MSTPSAVIRLPQKKHPFSHGLLPCRGGSGNLCGDHQYVGPTCGALPTVDPFVSTAVNQATSRATAVIEKPGLETCLGPLPFILKTLVTMVLITCRPTKRLHQFVAGGLPHLHEVRIPRIAKDTLTPSETPPQARARETNCRDLRGQGCQSPRRQKDPLASTQRRCDDGNDEDDDKLEY